MTYKQDYHLGKTNELQLLDQIRNYFNDNSINTCLGKYCKYDFESNTAIFEVKSRQIDMRRFNTTLIAFDKIIKTDKTQYFIFSFLDKLTYIKYDADLFSNFQLKSFKRTNRTDCIDIEKLYYHIPVNKLIIMNSKCMVQL